MLRKSAETGKVGRKLSHGWVVALAASIICFAAGNFQYTFGVFVKPLINQFGWSRAAISGCVTTRSLLSGVISPLMGNLSDKYGPRKLIFVGVFLIGLSYVMSSRISNLWQLYLYFGVLTGLGLGAFFSPLVSTVTKWFGGKAGLANGIVMSGFSVAQILLPPAATYFILKYSWETSLLLLGVAAWGIGLLPWSLVKKPPQNITSPPQATSTGARNIGKVEQKTSAAHDFTLSEALRTPTLWIMFTTYTVVSTCYQLMVIHIVAAAIDIGITPEAAAIILTLSGITNTVGRLTLGALSNKIGTKITLALCLAIQAPSLFFLAGASELHVFYITAMFFGLAYGGVAPIMPTMTATLFGTKAVGSIYGIMHLAFTVGAAIGPLLGGYIFDVTGSYSAAFLYAAGATAVSFLLLLLLKPPKKKALMA